MHMHVMCLCGVSMWWVCDGYNCADVLVCGVHCVVRHEVYYVCFV